MSKTVNRLGVPPMDLSITVNEKGNLQVELKVPRSSGSLANIPFLEVTRNEQETLLNGARQEIIAKTSQSGLTFGEVKYKVGGEVGQNGKLGGDAKVPELGKVTFEIGSNQKFTGSVETILKNNPDIAGAIRSAEKNFDIRRQNIYEERAREWYDQGGATLKSWNSEKKQYDEYTVTKEAAKNYVNERYPNRWWKRISDADDGSVQVASADPQVSGNERSRQTEISPKAGNGDQVVTTLASNQLATGNDNVNRQFEQALKATNGDRDAAALAVDTIRNAPGYKADEPIAVVAGKNGLIVSQGQGDAALNLQVPQSTPGDFDRVAARLQQVDPAQGIAQQAQAQQIAQTQQDPERTLPGRAV